MLLGRVLSDGRILIPVSLSITMDSYSQNKELFADTGSHLTIIHQYGLMPYYKKKAIKVGPLVTKKSNFGTLYRILGLTITLELKDNNGVTYQERCDWVNGSIETLNKEISVFAPASGLLGMDSLDKLSLDVRKSSPSVGGLYKRTA